MGILKTTHDILQGINATVWGGVEGAQKVGKIVKTGMSGADVVIGTSHALEDAACQDYICMTLDIVGSTSTALGMILGNIPATRDYTLITGSVTLGCRSVRLYCKKYGTFWGCTLQAADTAKTLGKIVLTKVLKN